jgi:hypothetical protein
MSIALMKERGKLREREREREQLEIAIEEGKEGRAEAQKIQAK